MLELQSAVRGVVPSPINTFRRMALGETAQIVGFGDDLDMRGSGVKKLGAISTESCSPSIVPDATHLCWTLRDLDGSLGSDSSTCFGDSGGPLFADLGTGRSVAGIHSGSFNDGACAVGDLTFDADVFVDRDWIEAEVGADLEAQRCGDGPQLGEAGVATATETGSIDTSTFHTFEVGAGTKLLRVALNAEDGLRVGEASISTSDTAHRRPRPMSIAHRSTPTISSSARSPIPPPEPGTRWWMSTDGSAAEYQLTATMLAEDPAPPPLSLGDALVADFTSHEIFRLGSAGGERAVVSSSLRGSGPPLRQPEDVVLEADGTLLVTNQGHRGLLRVDPGSGDRTLLSGCGDPACDTVRGSGPELLGPRFVAREDSGHLMLTDRAGVGTLTALVRIDEASGDRSVVSGCGDDVCSHGVGLGPAMERLFGIAIEADGSILAATSYALLRVDPDSGTRSSRVPAVRAPPATARSARARASDGSTTSSWTEMAMCTSRTEIRARPSGPSFASRRTAGCARSCRDAAIPCARRGSGRAPTSAAVSSVLRSRPQATPSSPPTSTVAASCTSPSRRALELRSPGAATASARPWWERARSSASRSD